MKHFGALIAGALAMLALGVGSAAAASNFTTDGGAHAIADTPRNNVYDLVSNTSNASSADDYSYLTKSGSGTLAGISNLSADYYVKSGNCGGGSPRFSITLDTNHNGTSDGHVWVYLGDTPGFSCSDSFQRWISTGDLTDSTDSRVDSSQLAGGAYGETWAQAKAQFGSAGVLAVTFAVDGGWAVSGGVQDVLVDNPLYNTKELGSPGGGATKTSVPTRHHVYDLDSNTGNASSSDDWSAVIFKQKKAWTLNDVYQLSTDYYVRSGGCGGGSPRFQVKLDTDGNGSGDRNVFVYVGDPASFTCASAFQRWQSTGNLVTSGDARVDTSQLPGGTFYDTFAHAKSLYGTKPVTAVTFAVDAGWAFGGDQDVWIDDLNVNGSILN